ncbi:MAG: glycerophosphodiester phosphodiesterase [Reyranellaceae bacterium]
MTDKKASAPKVGVVAAMLLLALGAGVVAHYSGWIETAEAEPQSAAAAGPAASQVADGGATASPRFDLQGHRGARGLAPENTLTGFHKALRLGVDTLELDLALTRDGVLVVTHDAALNPDIVRWPDGEWLNAVGPAIRSLTLDEVKRFDVGRIEPNSRYARMFPDQEPADGERIPTLKEVVDLARAIRPDARFNIEIKINPGKPEETADGVTFARAVVDFIRDEKLLNNVVVQSFDYAALQAVRKIEPRIALACLSVQRANFDNIRVGQPGPSPWTGGVDVDELGGSVPALAKAIGCAVWSPHWRDVDAVRVHLAHDLGLKVIPWTVNKPDDIAQILTMPIDGLITDYPDRARALMQERGLGTR